MYKKEEVLIARYLVDTKNRSTWHRKDKREQLIHDLCAIGVDIDTVDSIKNRLVKMDERKLKAVADYNKY